MDIWKLIPSLKGCSCNIKKIGPRVNNTIEFLTLFTPYYYNGNMNKKYVFLISLFFLFTVSGIFAASKAKKYDDLLREGSVKQLTEALSKDNEFYRMTFGPERNNILMQALKYDRPYEIIRLVSQSGIRINSRNKEKMDAVMFACAYSSKRSVIRYIVKRSTKPEEIKERLTSSRLTGKSPEEYAQENPSPVALKTVLELIGKTPDQGDIPDETENEEANPQDENEVSEETESENLENSENAEDIQNPVEEETEENQEENLPASETINYSKVYLFDYAPQDEEIFPEETEDDELYAKIDNPDQKDKLDRTLLMLAAKDGNDWEVKSLLKSNAKLNLKDKDGWTALMYAVRYQNNIELVKNLVENGADTKILNKYGSSALQIAAAYSNNPAIIKYLIDCAPDASAEIFKSFILSITAGGNNPVTQIGKLKIFIEHGVPVNRFYEGKTPLMYACEYGTTTELIKILLENGALAKVRTGTGKTAFDFAQLNTHLEHDDIYWSLNER